MSDYILPIESLRARLHEISSKVNERTSEHNVLAIGIALEQAAADGHARNRAAGWWSDTTTGLPKERNTGELLMLAVSELAEVPRYPFVMAMDDDKLPHRLMVEVEIADCIIRLLDPAGARKVNFSLCYTHLADANERQPFDVFLPRLLRFRQLTWKEIDVALMIVVRYISLAMEGDRKKSMFPGAGDCRTFDIGITRALVTLFKIGRLMAFDLVGAIIEKMEFNAAREDHKRESRMAPGGKAY